MYLHLGIFYEDKTLYGQTYNQRYNSESTYRFDFKIKGNLAFMMVTPTLLQKIEQIHELNKELFILMKEVPAVALQQYTLKCLIDEIKMTNDIEGVRSTRKEINELLIDTTKPKEFKRLYGVTKKYQLLLGKEEIKLSTCEDIRRLYNEFVLMDVKVEDANNIPDGGIFIKDGAQLKGSNQRTIHEGIYPEEAIIECMSQSLNMLNNEKYNFLIRIAVFHYMFGYIHPFYDGNGRMSRFISSYLLSKKLEYLVPCKLSSTIKQNLQTYYKMFKDTNEEKNKGDLTHFVNAFFDIIIESIVELCKAIKERQEKLKYYLSIIQYNFKDEKMINIIFVLVQNTLFGDEGLNVEEIVNATDVSESKTRSYLKDLDKMKLLKIYKNGRKNIYDIIIEKLEELDV